MAGVWKLTSTALVVIGLGGCGLATPEMREFYQSRADYALEQNDLVNHIQCELQQALLGTKDDLLRSGQPKTAHWLESWIAKVSLKVAVNERSAIEPSMTFADQFKNGSFLLGAGANASADATRVETIDFTYFFAELAALRPMTGPCHNRGGVMIHGDLKIADFVQRAAFLREVPGTLTRPFTAFNYQVVFVVAFGGNANPVWTLTDITAGGAVRASRTKTNDLTITMGPVVEDVDQQHLASLIGQSVANSLRARN